MGGEVRAIWQVYVKESDSLYNILITEENMCSLPSQLEIDYDISKGNTEDELSNNDNINKSSYHLSIAYRWHKHCN